MQKELIKKLRKGWSPFPIEIDSLMNEAADQLDVVDRLIRIEKILEKQTQMLSQIHKHLKS